MNGCLTGLVAITAGCATVDTWAAVVIGIFAGWFYLGGSWLLIRFKIDDAVDAIPVHMVGGAWGVISTGLFTTKPRLQEAFGMDEHIGWFYEWGRGSGNFTLLGAQIVSVLFIFGWTAIIMGGFFYILKILGWLRIDPLEEAVGMDISRHKGVAYDIDSPKQELVNQLNDSRSNRNLRVSERTSAAAETLNDNTGDAAEPEGPVTAVDGDVEQTV